MDLEKFNAGESSETDITALELLDYKRYGGRLPFDDTELEAKINKSCAELIENGLPIAQAKMAIDNLAALFRDNWTELENGNLRLTLPASMESRGISGFSPDELKKMEIPSIDAEIWQRVLFSQTEQIPIIKGEGVKFGPSRVLLKLPRLDENLNEVESEPKQEKPPRPEITNDRITWQKANPSTIAVLEMARAEVTNEQREFLSSHRITMPRDSEIEQKLMERLGANHQGKKKHPWLAKAKGFYKYLKIYHPSPRT